jgi:hypothetical protein
LLQNWPRNASNVEENEYKTLVVAYGRELDSLISTSYIIRSLEEEESPPPHIENAMMDLE